MHRYAGYAPTDAGETVASYGSMSMFKQVQRMHILRNNVIIGFDGEYSDFTYIIEELEKMLWAARVRTYSVGTSLPSPRTTPCSRPRPLSTSFVPGSTTCAQKWSPCGTHSWSSASRATNRRHCEFPWGANSAVRHLLSRPRHIVDPCGAEARSPSRFRQRILIAL